MIDRTIVQQLKDYDESKMRFPCIGQVKMDGIFGRYSSISGEFFTRSKNRIRGLDVLKAEMKEITTPYDGELVIPNLDFFTMNGLLRSYKQTPTCKYYIFDQPTEKVGYEYRVWEYNRMDIKPHVVFMKSHTLNNQFEADTFYDRVLAAGHEGVVYKQPNGLYRHGKHWENMKRVPVKTCECTILSAYEGKGKLAGLLGGFIVDFNGVKVKVGGGPGVDYAKRKFMWDNRADAIGQPMKCQYKKLTPKGSMRSPQMLGVRWDI